MTTISTNLMTYNICTWNKIRKVRTSVWVGQSVSQSVSLTRYMHTINQLHLSYIYTV